MSYTAADAYSAAVAAGFTPDEAVTAAAIALAESGGNERAVNTTNRNGSVDHGAWQINSVHKEILRGGDPYSLADNARMAFIVFRNSGRRFTPWTTYKSGAYKRHVSAVKAAVERPAKDGESVAPGALVGGLTGGVLAGPAAAKVADTPLSAAIEGINRFDYRLQKFGSDFATMALATVLLALGIAILLRNTAPVRAASSVGKTALAMKTGGLIK